MFDVERIGRVSVDWLIDYCLASSEQYFNYIQDENNINNISKLYRNKERDGSTGSTTFEWRWNSVKSWVRTNNLVFSDGYMPLLFFAIYQRGVSVQGAWNYPNNLPTMIHNQDFRIITWQSSHISQPEMLCQFEPKENPRLSREYL